MSNELPSAIDRLQGYKFTRKEFLFLSGVVASPFAPNLLRSLLTPRFAPIKEQSTAWAKAGVSNDQFLEENRQKLNQVRIGGSFSPEQVYYLNEKTGKDSNPLAILEYIVEDLNIADLRLGARWSHVMPQPNIIDISSYIPSVDYCLEKGVNICLNEGLKTFRWPEQHIPGFLKNSKLPPKNAVITPDMEIAKQATDYLDRLMQRLTSEYGKALQKGTPIVQVENEPFVNFGEYGWTMSEEYLEKAVALAQSYFPDSEYLFNSGPFVVAPISRLFDRLADKDLKLIYGTDYYYQIDDPENKYNWLLQLPAVKDLDLVTFSKLAGQPIQPQSRASFKTEITEGQVEGWGSYDKPGNVAREFRYLLLRCMDDILDMDTQEYYIIRLWGLEALAQKLQNREGTKEHQHIAELIRAINQHTKRAI